MAVLMCLDVGLLLFFYHVASWPFRQNIDMIEVEVGGASEWLAAKSCRPSLWLVDFQSYTIHFTESWEGSIKCFIKLAQSWYVGFLETHNNVQALSDSRWYCRLEGHRFTVVDMIAYLPRKHELLDGIRLEPHRLTTFCGPEFQSSLLLFGWLCMLNTSLSWPPSPSWPFGYFFLCNYLLTWISVARY